MPIPAEQREQEARALLENQHVTWLQSAVTQNARKILEARANNSVNYLAAKCVDRETSDSRIRLEAAKLAVVNAIIEALFNTDSFCDRLSKLTEQETTI